MGCTYVTGSSQFTFRAAIRAAITIGGCGWSRHSGNRCDDESAVKGFCSNDSTVVKPTSVYRCSTWLPEELHTVRFVIKNIQKLTFRLAIKAVAMSIESTWLGCVGCRIEVSGQEPRLARGCTRLGASELVVKKIIFINFC